MQSELFCRQEVWQAKIASSIRPTDFKTSNQGRLIFVQKLFVNGATIAAKGVE